MARHHLSLSIRPKGEWNHCQATQAKMALPDNPLRKTITAEGPIQLEEMFKVGNSLIDNLPVAISVAVAANKPEDSAPIRLNVGGSAAVSTPARIDHRHLRQTLYGAGDFASAGRSVKTKTIISASNDVGHVEKSNLKVAVRSHHESTRHRSHSPDLAPRRKT
jgi:hypothetical protein